MPLDYLRLAGIVVVLCLFPAGFIVGCMEEKEKFDAYKGQVAAIGEAQERRTQERIADDQRAKRKVDDDYKARVASLGRALGDMRGGLREQSSRSVVPALPAAPAGSGGREEGSGVVCFARDRLSAGITAELSGFAERYAEGVQRGASAIAGFQTCAAWALEEAAKAAPTKVSP